LIHFSDTSTVIYYIAFIDEKNRELLFLVIMKNSLLHIVFWFCYFVYALGSDYIVYGQQSVLDELVGIIINPVMSFYLSFYFLKNWSHNNIKALLKSLFILTVTFSILFLSRFFYLKILSKILTPPPHNQFELTAFIGNTISWYIWGFIWALGYFFALKSNLNERKLQEQAIEKLKLLDEKVQLEQQKQLLEKKQLQTEAAFLRSQINPHFLQNTLNFLYGKTRKHASELSEGVLLLSEIMHYSLEATKNTEDVTILKDEVQHLKNLIKLQQLRFSNQLFIELSTSGKWEQVKLPPLTLITLAENAFKYGEMHDEQHPVIINLQVTEDGKQLRYEVHNKKKTGPVEISYGIGHDNIRNRLSMRYHHNFELLAKDENDFYAVYLLINLN
jgi:sensor histidine kinase YesM